MLGWGKRSCMYPSARLGGMLHYCLAFNGDMGRHYGQVDGASGFVQFSKYKFPKGDIGDGARQAYPSSAFQRQAAPEAPRMTYRESVQIVISPEVNICNVSLGIGSQRGQDL